MIKYEEIYSKSIRNKTVLEQTDLCGCFHCLKIFNPTEINSWTDNGSTAICPHCGVDSILPFSKKKDNNETLLSELHDCCFGPNE